MRYLHEKGQPFRGSVHSSTYLDANGVERVQDYSGKPGPTIEEYSKERGKEFDILDDEALNVLIAGFTQSMISKPEKIGSARYYELLEVLPPARWESRNGFTAFFVPEPIWSNLVTWCIADAKGYYSFTERANISEEKLNEIAKNIGKEEN